VEYTSSSDHYLAGAPTQRFSIMESIYMLRYFVTSLWNLRSRKAILNNEKLLFSPPL